METGKGKKKNMRATQDQLLDLAFWLTKSKEKVNDKTQMQIESVLELNGFVMPWSAVRNALIKAGINIQVQTRRFSKTPQPVIVRIEKQILLQQNRIDELEIELKEAREMIRDVAQVLIKTPPFTTETRARFQKVRDDIQEAIENAEQERRRRKVHSDTTGNSSEVQTVPERLESGNGAIQVASRLAKPNTGNSIRNSNNTNGR